MQEKQYEVVYPLGVDWRLSAHYGDKDPDAPQGPMQGDKIIGRAVMGCLTLVIGRGLTSLFSAFQDSREGSSEEFPNGQGVFAPREA